MCALSQRKGEKEVEYSCDKWIYLTHARCGIKPYVEVYLLDEHSWSYLCRWHYYMDRLKCKIFRIKSHGYWKVEK